MANDTPGIRVIPLAIYLAALLVGFLVDWLWPVRLLPDPMRYGLGGLLVLASLVAIYPVLRSLKRAKTPFDTRRAENALVTEGLFGYSRNPGYVSMIVLCVGIAVLADNMWVIATTAIATVFLDRHVVAAEERHLEARFGAAYRTYKSRVRRWL